MYECEFGSKERRENRGCWKPWVGKNDVFLVSFRRNRKRKRGGKIAKEHDFYNMQTVLDQLMKSKGDIVIDEQKSIN